MILSPSPPAAQSEPGHGAGGGTSLSFYEGRGEPADKTSPAASKQPTQSRRAASARARRARKSEPTFDYSAFPESIQLNLHETAAAIHARLGVRLQMGSGADVV